MPLTKDFKSSERTLFRNALKVIRGLMRNILRHHSKMTQKEIRDVWDRAVKSAIPLKRGRPHEQTNLAAFQMRQEGKDWPEVFRRTLGPKPAEGENDFTYRCGVREIKRGVRRLERQAKSKQKSLLISSSPNPDDISLRNS